MDLVDAGTPLTLVIDDAEALQDGPMARYLDGLVRRARDLDLLIVAAVGTDDLLANRHRGWLAELRRSRTGILLSPRSHTDGEAFDLRLSRHLDTRGPVGRGLLVVDGEPTAVQVARPGRPARRPGPA